jgi:hypothetical protein
MPCVKFINVTNVFILLSVIIIMLNLTSYQQCLLIAYATGVMVQVVSLYIISFYFDQEIEFIMIVAPIYVLLAILQFTCFLKLVDHK